MIRKISNYIKRKYLRIYESNHFFKEKCEELEKEVADKTIWVIGTAHYDNIGDLAISEATINYLNEVKKEHKIIEIRLCDYYKYKKALKKFVKKEDIIVLQGGGNMCFSYFDAEYNRRCLIKLFPKNKIIIFPVTIDYEKTFRGKLEFWKAKRLYRKHKDITICARENKTYKVLKENFRENNIIFVPDIVLNEKFRVYNNKRNGICICLRNDNEKGELAKKVREYFESKNVKYTDNVSEIKNVSIEERKNIVDDKMKEYASSELVITDRLHTMIFCYITKTPCLFLDNFNGKVSRVYNDWIKITNNTIKSIDLEELENDIGNMRQSISNITAKNIIREQFKILELQLGD